MGEGGGGRRGGVEAPVKASVSGVSLLQLSPVSFFASIFPLFPQKRLILRLLMECLRRGVPLLQSLNPDPVLCIHFNPV